jgi:hypothetical protein
MGMESIMKLIDSESKETLGPAIDGMYEYAMHSADGEEYEEEVREYQVWQLRNSLVSMEIEFASTDQFELAAIVRDKLKEKDW